MLVSWNVDDLSGLAIPVKNYLINSSNDFVDDVGLAFDLDGITVRLGLGELHGSV